MIIYIVSLIVLLLLVILIVKYTTDQKNELINKEFFVKKEV